MLKDSKASAAAEVATELFLGDQRRSGGELFVGGRVEAERRFAFARDRRRPAISECPVRVTVFLRRGVDQERTDQETEAMRL